MAEKEKAVVPEIIDNVEALEAKMKAMREAQKVFATYTQEQVDRIFYEAAMAANKQRIPLAKMAVEETKRGVMEDKVIKNHYAAEYIYNAYKDTKTCGVIEEDSAYGIKKISEPIGLVAAVIPTTNPTSMAIFKTLICLKTRNAIIISPHPSAKACTIAAAKVVLEAAVKAGAPEGIIGWIDVPSLELTNTVMRESDIILATGGPGMVKAAYSSGKPALGVGAGNTPVIIDDSADIRMAVNSIIHSKTFDNGMICASEQSVTVLDSIYDDVKREFAYRGCYFLKPGEEVDKVRKTIIINGALNSKIPGKSAYEIAQLAGIDVPENTKILIGEVESVDISEEFAHEKLSPVLAMYRAKTFDEALEKAAQLVADGGYGHTSSLYVDPSETEKIQKHYEAMKTCRVLINTPSSHGGIGDLYNFKLAPSLTLGCGSWGGNSVSENVGVKHLLNVKTVAERRENMLWFRTPEKVYFKKGCTPVALAELGNVMHKKKAFIVTDTFLYKNGYADPIEKKMDEMGLTYEKDGALWFKSTEYGDDKDRVLRKSDGTLAYLTPDIANHIYKIERGYPHLLDLWGADHHSYVTRMKLALKALGYPEDTLTVDLIQMVRMVEDGKEVKMSKRSGTYVTLRDLVNWVGKDAARFFLVSRKADSEFVFDIDLALSQSDENPVYYLQYAHARICSVFAQAKEKGFSIPTQETIAEMDLSALSDKNAQALIARISEFPETLSVAAKECAPHTLCFYLKDLAGDFHAFYNAEHVLVEDERERNARLALLLAARQVLRNGLDVLGVSAPEHM